MTAVQSTVKVPEVHVVTVGERGPPGPAGTGGSGGDMSVQKVANVAISAYRAVVLDGPNGVLLADNTDMTHRNMILGITTTAAVQNDSITVRRIGELEFLGWAWTPGELIFAGVGGVLTQVPPVFPAVFSQAVATAVSATKIDVNLRLVALIL